jgi:hypothetical protein
MIPHARTLPDRPPARFPGIWILPAPGAPPAKIRSNRREEPAPVKAKDGPVRANKRDKREEAGPVKAGDGSVQARGPGEHSAQQCSPKGRPR